MIQSFADRATEAFFAAGTCPARWRSFVKVARRKLDNLRNPPGNRLEALKGDRKGQWSIRINDQWRVCFMWTAHGPTDVEITDYH